VDSQQTPQDIVFGEVDRISSSGNGMLRAGDPDKVVAICPTCHKRIHHGAGGDALNDKLRKKLENTLSAVGKKIIRQQLEDLFAGPDC